MPVIPAPMIATACCPCMPAPLTFRHEASFSQPPQGGSLSLPLRCVQRCRLPIGKGTRSHRRFRESVGMLTGPKFSPLFARLVASAEPAAGGQTSSVKIATIGTHPVPVVRGSTSRSAVARPEALQHRAMMTHPADFTSDGGPATVDDRSCGGGFPGRIRKNLQRGLRPCRRIGHRPACRATRGGTPASGCLAARDGIPPFLPPDED